MVTAMMMTGDHRLGSSPLLNSVEISERGPPSMPMCPDDDDEDDADELDE